jgi:hypothetical protein
MNSEGAQRRERRDGVGKRNQPRSGEAGRHPDHVLLGDAGVEKAFGIPIAERLERHVAEVAGEQHDPRIVLASSQSVCTKPAASASVHFGERRLELRSGHRQVMPVDRLNEQLLA